MRQVDESSVHRINDNFESTSLPPFWQRATDYPVAIDQVCFVGLFAFYVCFAIDGE